MPAPEYSPPGRPSASPSTTSIAETEPERAGELAREPRGPQRHQRRRLAPGQQVGAQQRPQVDVAERRRHLLVDDAHHLLGRDAVGGQRGDERAGRRADVDVELVDRAVDRQQVERAQRADLVDAAGEAAAAEDERGLRRGAGRRRGADFAPCRTAAACPARGGPRSPSVPECSLGVMQRRTVQAVVCAPRCGLFGRARGRRRARRPRRCASELARAVPRAGRALRRLRPRPGHRAHALLAPRHGQPARPASNEKLLVTAAALLTYGPGRTAAHRARGPAPRRPAASSTATSRSSGPATPT